MDKILKLNRKDGEVIEGTLKELDYSHIDKIMELQQVILDGLEDVQLYAPTEKEEFIEYIEKGGKIIGCITPDNDLIAMGVYMKKGYDAGNYGHDMDIKGEELLKVGQIESTIVTKEFRGNGLQRILCEVLEKIGEENGTPIMTATASPYNEFSVNTFKKLGYEIVKEKIKYGGMKRYVLVKRL